MSPTTSTTGTTAAHDQVRAAHDQLCRALVAADLDQLDGLLDEGYTATHITGHVSPKAEWLDLIRSGDFVYRSITEDTTRVDVHAGTATTVSTALYAVTLHSHRGRYRLRSTLTWSLDHGTWTALRGEATTA